ncbi:MAG: hypothetical protein ACQ9MH_15870 [Nitrospinales bacterium]
MSDTKKDGFIKRLFGGKKEGCCGVQIEEIKDDVEKKINEHEKPSRCCNPDNKKQ